MNSHALFLSHTHTHTSCDLFSLIILSSFPLLYHFYTLIIHLSSYHLPCHSFHPRHKLSFSHWTSSSLYCSVHLLIILSSTSIFLMLSIFSMLSPCLYPLSLSLFVIFCPRSYHLFKSSSLPSFTPFANFRIAHGSMCMLNFYKEVGLSIKL